MSSARKEIIATAHKLAERSWVANHDGNISVRLSDKRFLATPTATSKADVCDKNLIEVDDTGKKVAGTARPFSELKMHLAIFADREDVGAVVHAHPPYATALACTGSPIIEQPFIAEAIVSLGPLIPTLPFAAPGPDAVQMLRREVQRVDAVLLANHGVFSWGPTLELAYLRMELVEHLARIATIAQATGGVQPLPQKLIEKLLASRAKAKLGKAADRAMDFVNKSVVACAPAPHANVQTISHSGSGNRSQLASIIKEELSKLLD
jgi:L-fuculose-phosphate aldolase